METRSFELDSSGVVLKGKVLLPPARRPVPLIILCHGIPSGEPAPPGDPGYEALAGRFMARGVAACIFNFRGTGESGGDFSLPGWMEDLTTVLDEAASRRNAFEGCDPGRLALMGFSGGGAVSIVCAARRPGLRALVSVSSPADFTHLLSREGIGDFITHARRIGIIRDPGFPASEEEYYEGIHACRPVKEVSRISPTPLLIIHGAEDEKVPLSEARLLYEAAKEPKELIVVPGGGHKLRHHVETMERATDWLLQRL